MMYAVLLFPSVVPSTAPTVPSIRSGLPSASGAVDGASFLGTATGADVVGKGGAPAIPGELSVGELVPLGCDATAGVFGAFIAIVAGRVVATVGRSVFSLPASSMYPRVGS